jgi:hypothetical protein
LDGRIAPRGYTHWFFEVDTARPKSGTVQLTDQANP